MTTAAPLEGTTWQLIAYLDSAGNLTLPYRESPATLTMADGQAGGNTGCNNYFGSYTLDGDSLTFGPMGATMMACPEPQSMQEQAYLAGLENVASYAIVGNQLHLLNADGEIIMAFEPQVSVGLTGTIWSATMVNNGKEAVVSLINGTEITAIFGDDGSLSGSAGCNSYTTSYEVDGDSITIGMGASTMMFCGEPEGVMDQEQQYLAALQTVATWSIAGDKLELRTADGALAVSYVAAGEAAAAAPADTGDMGDETRGPVSEPVDEATMVVLRNMTYTNVAVTDTVTLTNGVYTSTVSPDVPVGIYVESTDYAAAGELNGVASVATILVSNGGGSGVFYDLAVVQDVDGVPTNVATILLGDRVSIISLDIVDNQVVVDMITQGPDEPMCCGTLEVVNTYELQGNELVETASEPVGTVDQGPTDESIVGVLWEWVETAYSDDTTVTVDDPSKYTMLLNDDGTANFQIDCNMGGGTYELDGSTLRLDVSTMTRVACPEGTLSDVFVRDLNGAATYVMDGPDLIINLFADTGNMRFRMSENQPAATESAPEVAAEGVVTPTLTQPASAADILSKPWQWVAFTDPVNGMQEIANPANYTIQFQPSGVARIQADCNRGAGGYTIDGSSISIKVGAMTRAQCAADSQGDAFTQYLDAAAVWFMDGEDLYIDLFASSGTMKFAPGS
ncbi:MAG: META domain-containing protein [Caldilineales bacterium]